MKKLFPQFDPGAKTDYKLVWEKSIFVFDTNVLLNLYRYQVGTRDQLLDVLDKLSDRIWIPHHVGLEFQRNRMKVLADQSKRFSEVRTAVDAARRTLRSDLEKLQLDRRHSLINPTPLTDGFDRLTENFLEDLARIQKAQQKLTDSDPLKDKIETLFEGRIGEEPQTQEYMENLYKEAEIRFENKIPPGYMDKDKDIIGFDSYIHNGILYKRKFGDYLIWKQILEYTKKKKIKKLVFVTDDSKEDWWWRIESDGLKTLGPGPELVEEARRLGKVDSFHMYKPEGFLTYSKDFLEADVSSETLEEVRDVSNVRSIHDENYRLARSKIILSEMPVLSD